MAVICDFIREIGDLRFERGILRVKPLALAGMIVSRVMFCQAFTHLPGKIQTGKRRIFLFQMFDNSEAVLVVFKTAVTFHEAGQCGFTLVSKR